MLTRKPSKVKGLVAGPEFRALYFINQNGVLDVSYLIVFICRNLLKKLSWFCLMATISAWAWDFTRRHVVQATVHPSKTYFNWSFLLQNLLTHR